MEEPTTGKIDYRYLSGIVVWQPAPTQAISVNEQGYMKKISK